MKMRIDGEHICIYVNPIWEYEARPHSIGEETDQPGSFSAYGWMAHLDEKVWWQKSREANRARFLQLAKQILKKKP
jgi:hypothetical protein